MVQHSVQILCDFNTILSSSAKIVIAMIMMFENSFDIVLYFFTKMYRIIVVVSARIKSKMLIR
jgi:hypothetical protein